MIGWWVLAGYEGLYFGFQTKKLSPVSLHHTYKEKIQKKIQTTSWQRKRKKDDHIHRKGEREMADEEVEAKKEPPFALKVIFVLVVVSLFLAYPFYTCFLDPPSPF